MYFIKDELDEGITFNKSLYIRIKCKDYVITNVLIDNKSTLNALHKHFLDWLLVNAPYKRPSIMIENPIVCNALKLSIQI